MQEADQLAYLLLLRPRSLAAPMDGEEHFRDLLCLRLLDRARRDDDPRWLCAVNALAIVYVKASILSRALLSIRWPITIALRLLDGLWFLGPPILGHYLRALFRAVWRNKAAMKLKRLTL